MKPIELERMSLDDLWELHVEIAETLASKMGAEKNVLEGRLKQLKSTSPADQQTRTPGRRPYPAVFPKFQNPKDPSQTWAGRGKQPRWLTEQLKSGRRMSDFRIQQAAE
jgi:DNA-binding protein H-NS